MPDGVRCTGVIESPRNERIRLYRRLRKRNFRYREGKFLVEGMQCVSEALRHARKPECLICDERGMRALEAQADVIRRRGIPCFLAREAVISALCDTVTPQGVLAVMPMLAVDLDELLESSVSTVVVADRVRDPGNLGSILRTADAAGADGLVACSESADLYNPKTVRSTAGSIFHLAHSVGCRLCEAVDALRSHGFTVIAAHPHAGKEHWDLAWPEKTALVLGNEAWGIPEEDEGLMDEMVKVPILGKAESLNVAAAAAVILYEMERARGKGRGGRNTVGEDQDGR